MNWIFFFVCLINIKYAKKAYEKKGKGKWWWWFEWMKYKENDCRYLISHTHTHTHKYYKHIASVIQSTSMKMILLKQKNRKNTEKLLMAMDKCMLYWWWSKILKKYNK